MSDENNQDEEYFPPRRVPRFSSTNLLNYEFFDADVSCVNGVGVTKSLSEGGLMFESDREIRQGIPLSIQFILLGTLITVKGDVLYGVDQGENVFHIGVKFTEISEKHKQFIHEEASKTLPPFETK